MGVGRVGLETDGFAALGDRLLQFPLIAKDGAEICVSLCRVGLETDGFAALGDRLL